MSLVPAALLSQVPNTLHSLVKNYWLDWCLSCEKESLDPSSDIDLSALGYVWACSDFVARNCTRHPPVFYELQAEGLNSARRLEDYQERVAQVVTSVSDETQLMKALRELRQKEMVRIAWRDLNALADDETVLHELSDFAEAMVAITLRSLEKQQAEIYGMPCDASGEELALLTFAMGKMGGRELNFSSDIDLIFAFAEEGETAGPRKTSHYEFYLSVIRKLIKVLDEVTADGFVYRVDIRLRPFGESGPLAMSFSGMEQYYQLQGRDWERYAMIKAKLITGRDADKHYLQSLLTPFVYRRYLDFNMIDSIREMKAMINAQVKRKRMTNNVKLGPGGIREIEFIGQTLQLIRAGREPELRERGIINVLTLLVEKEYLQKQEVVGLKQAYWFLRKLENRLQMQRDMQTHALPDDELSQQRLCLAMNFASWDEFLAVLKQHQKAVDAVFQDIITPQNTVEKDHGHDDFVSGITLFWENTKNAVAEVEKYLIDAGFSNVDEIIKLLVDLRDSPQLKRIASDSRRLLIPLIISLLRQIADYPQQQILLDRVSRLIKALAGRKVYISLLNEFPQTQQQMLRLCAVSEWFAERLSRYPLLLDGLLASAEVFKQQDDVRQLLDIELKRIEPSVHQGVVDDDLEQQMDRMRQFKRQTVFSVAVADVFYAESVETVSDRLTELANIMLEKSLQLSWQSMVARYGEPECMVDGEAFKPTISIVAYGKMGGNELGYGSDLDIIFLHNSRGEKQYTQGEKSIDNQNFFARVAQRVIHLLNTRTYSGMLYEVDTRLRPNGQSGLMVSSISAFETYQREKAWTWEHQALIRARFVTGNALIEQEFDRIRSSVLRQPVDEGQLLQDVVIMRDKMRQHLTSKAADFDIKQGAGGLVDIEFMTQAGVLMHAESCGECIEPTATLELINELTKVGWYTPAEADNIAHAYRYFRKLKNWQDLACEADLDKLPEHRDNVVAVWNRLMPEVVGNVE